ncbi:MAG: recombinase family protein [Nitrospirae bacterium]|nr:recombinase family protein [Nitrospirota bacterium]MBF0344572.1 recombinase family protein [Nitrospirota bacterium]
MLIANPLEQEAIVKIKELRAKGYSLRAICTELTREGYKPQGAAWYPTTIKNILERAA